jgi:hypothetical protein
MDPDQLGSLLLALWGVNGLFAPREGNSGQDVASAKRQDAGESAHSDGDKANTTQPESGDSERAHGVEENQKQVSASEEQEERGPAKAVDQKPNDPTNAVDREKKPWRMGAPRIRRWFMSLRPSPQKVICVLAILFGGAGMVRLPHTEALLRRFASWQALESLAPVTAGLLPLTVLAANAVRSCSRSRSHLLERLTTGALVVVAALACLVYLHLAGHVAVIANLLAFLVLVYMLHHIRVREAAAVLNAYAILTAPKPTHQGGPAGFRWNGGQRRATLLRPRERHSPNGRQT